MARQVKRKYESPRREEQARWTRREILAAAHRLFSRDGYGATTVQAVADEAGVAVQTVYWVFGNKRAILWSLLETTVAGDDSPMPVLERIRGEIDEGDDAVARLEKVLRRGSRIVERSADVYRILRGAATGDPEIAGVLSEAEARRYQDARSLVELIAGPDGLAGDVDVATAADLFYALTSYEIYELLVSDRGWPRDRWEEWTKRALECLVFE